MRSNASDRPLLRSASSVQYLVLLALAGFATAAGAMALSSGLAGAFVRSAGCLTEAGRTCIPAAATLPTMRETPTPTVGLAREVRE